MPMSAGDLLSPKVQENVSRLVGEIETKTAAEIVVVVRAVSGRYLHADMTLGGLLAFAWICIFLFHPAPFDDDLVPFQILAAFVLGMLLSLFIQPLRRAFTPKTWRNENVERAARSAFVENGVHRTSKRTGLLVFVSTFERRAFLVSDIAFETDELRAELSQIQGAIEANIGTKDAIAKFEEALRELGRKLETALPVVNDDVNELSNEVAS